MTRLLFACGLVLLAWTTRGDDIDIYRAVGSPPDTGQRVVLVVDWAGAAATGTAPELPGVIVSAVERHLAWREHQPGLGDLSLVLLVPRELVCDAQPDCEFEQPQLLEFDDLVAGERLAALDSLLVALATAAADPMRGLPAYRVSHLWPELRELIDARAYPETCGGLEVVQLLQGAVEISPGEVDPAWTAGLRSKFLVPADNEAYRQLAALAPGKLLVGGGLAQLGVVLQAALTEIDESPAALLSAAVPAFTPRLGEAGSEVLFPLFGPAAAPPWPGNLKALRLVEDGLGGQILAQAPLSVPPRPGIDPVDGAIHREALTFWTDPLGWDVQSHDPSLGEVPGADGRSVRRGGAGQGIPGFLRGQPGAQNADPGARQFYIMTGVADSPLLPLGADEATAVALSLPTGAALEDSLALLSYIRGYDATDLDGDGNSGEQRPWSLGAVMHSQPLVIDYGARPGSGHSLAHPDVRVIYGGNDGLLHMLASTAATPGPGEPGREVWAALPRELLGQQRRLAGLQPVSGGGYPYGVDGSPAAHVLDRDRDGSIEPEEGDRVWVFFGLRRGGSAYYALDISDPDQPRQLWQLSPSSPGFGRLALGFATPRPVRIDLGEDEPRLALIITAGYHGGWRGTAALGKDAGAGPDPVGNAIFVVDAATGTLIWRAQGPGEDRGELPAPLSDSSMGHSIPASVTVVDADGNGITDRAYVADSGGQVWRIDLTEAGGDFSGSTRELIDRWSVRRVATLGGTGQDDRRFFHALDFATTRDGLGPYDALLLVSGDRARPRETDVRNYAYLIKDRGGQAVRTQENLTDVTVLCRQPDSQACREADLSSGWKLALERAGEKGLSAPLLRSGVAYFSTYHPPVLEGTGCPAGVGEGAVYAVKLANGGPAVREVYRARTWESEADRPAPEDRYFAVGSGIPGAVIPYRDFLILPGNGPDGERVLAPPGTLRWLSHWRENGVDVP